MMLCLSPPPSVQAHKLSTKQLKVRKVHEVDIAADKLDRYRV